MRDPVKEAMEMLGRPQELNKYINIPTQLEDGELDEVAKPHSHFAGYDHSLEINRLPALREKYDYVEPEHATDIDPQSFDTEQYENIDPKDVPNLNGIFDDLF